MKWITHLNDTEYKIESTAVNAANNIFYTWEKALIKVTSKINASGIYCTINGEKYEFYKYGDFVVVEITDQTRAFNSGSVLIEDYDDRQIAVINWVSRKGEKPTKENINYLPSEIPFSSANPTIPFYLEVSHRIEVLNVGGSWILFGAGDYISDPTNYPMAKDFALINDYHISPKLLLREKGILKKMQEIACTTDMIRFEWIGRFGVKKSWWFKIDKTIYSTSKTLDIQTMDNGFNTLKDKNTNLIISHRNADNLTQNYLSDIVLSDDVFCYPDETLDGKIQVKIDNSNFEVSKRNRDIILTVNKNQYDTI